MKRFLVFTDEISKIMDINDIYENWEEKLGLAVKYQSFHKDPINTIFEIIDEKKAAKYFAHSKVKILDEKEINNFLNELNKDFPEYVLKDGTVLLCDLLLSGKIKISDLTREAKIEGYNPNKPITDQENLKTLYNAGLGGIIKRPKPRIE